MPKIKIILDTDIGDDIDDAIALSMALGSPEFELLGVTVVYGDVHTRARIARKLLRAWGRTDVPVVAGYARPMGFDYHKGTAPIECSQRDAVAADSEPLDLSVGAAQFIANMVRRFPGEVNVLTIGAKTNAGAALCAEPALARQIAGIYSNAGLMPPKEEFEWNLGYDPLAARCIARSGAPWTVLGVDVCKNAGLRRAELDALAASKHPGVQALCELIVLYARNKGKDPNVRSIADVKSAWSSDADTLFALLVPERMGLQHGSVEVNEKAGITFKPSADGPHRCATKALPEEFRADLQRRLLGQ